MFSIASNGDVSVSGTIFAGSATISTPGNPGDLAETVDVSEDTEAGDVLVVDLDHNDTYKKSTKSYETTVAGVVSTNPSLTIGDGKTEQTAVLALVGRVPVKVTDQNGPIQRGDLLVTASAPGYAMKYDHAHPASIIGIALEPLTSGTGKIMMLLKSSLASASSPTVLSIGSTTSGQIVSNDFQGGSLLNVASIIGLNNRWKIDEQGHFITIVDTPTGPTSLYALSSSDSEYVLSGSAQLENGERRVDLSSVRSQMNATSTTMRVYITPQGTDQLVRLYVAEKTVDSFLVKEVNGGTSNGIFDWIAIIKE